jgi:glycosyltransferase 2 family protein
MTYLRILIGLAISIACVIVLLSQINLQLTAAALGRAQPAWLVLAVVILLVTMLTKSYRWGLLYYPTRGLHFGNLTSALFIGYMVSSLVPMRLGELVRAYLIGKKEPVTFSQSVGTILVEKVLDIVTILGFLAVLGLIMPLPPQVAGSGPLLAATGLGGLAVLFGLAWLPREKVLRVLARLQLYVPGSRRWNLVKVLGPFLEALAILRYWRLLPALAFWSVLNWSLSALINYVVMLAMDVPAPFAAAIFLMVVANLGMVVPSAPGYVGVFHALAVLALSAFGVDPSYAMGYAVVLHAIVYGTFIVVGLLCAWRGGYRLGDLRPGQGPPAPGPAADVGAPLAAPVVATSGDRSISA